MAIIWIVKLKHPLSLAALLGSLSIGGEYHPAEVDASVINRCDGLVMVDTGSSCVHLAPYEIDEAAKDIWPGSYDATVCMLAAACLNYLTLEEFGSGCRETEEELIQLLAAHPFLDYAARYRAYHTRDVCEIQSSHANGEPDDDNDTKGVQNPRVTSGPRIQKIAETLLETPNSLLALQILLYRDKAAAPLQTSGQYIKRRSSPCQSYRRLLALD